MPTVTLTLRSQRKKPIPDGTSQSAFRRAPGSSKSGSPELMMLEFDDHCCALSGRQGRPMLDRLMHAPEAWTAETRKRT